MTLILGTCFWMVVCMGCLEVELASSGIEFEATLKELVENKATKHVKPLDLENNTVHVEVDLYHIHAVDEKNGLLILKLWTSVYYYSPSVSWNPAEYGNYSSIQLPQESVWDPDVGEYQLTPPPLEGLTRPDLKVVIRIFPSRNERSIGNSLCKLRTPDN